LQQDIIYQISQRLTATIYVHYIATTVVCDN